MENFRSLFRDLNEQKSPKKKNIKNKQYRLFLDEGIINTISEKQIIEVIDNIKGLHSEEAKALVSCLYYTGARPNEVLRLKAKDIDRDKHHIKVRLPASKNGLPRTIYLLFKKPLVKVLYNFALKVMPERYMFWNFQSRYKRTRKNKRGVTLERIEYSDRMRYHFYKWFSILEKGTVPPYFLRHNRFSKLSIAGSTMEELRMLKGSKTFSSIIPYIHLSEATAKKVAKKME